MEKAMETKDNYTMIIPVAEARQLMGEANKKYRDEQIEEVVNIFDFLADISIDCYLIKRKKMSLKINQKQILLQISKKRR